MPSLRILHERQRFLIPLATKGNRSERQKERENDEKRRARRNLGGKRGLKGGEGSEREGNGMEERAKDEERKRGETLITDSNSTEEGTERAKEG